MHFAAVCMPIDSIDFVPATIAIALFFFHHLTHPRRIQLLLHHSLCTYNLRQPLQPRCLQPTRRVSLQGCDYSRLRNLVWAGVVHVHSLQKQNVGLRVCDTGGDGLHDLAVNGLLVVGNEVLVQKLLDLIG
jgi:hypothetical protein